LCTSYIATVSISDQPIAQRFTTPIVELNTLHNTMTIVQNHAAHAMPHAHGNMDPDILLGAYLMSHLRQYCENCGTFETPQWRKGWYSDVLHRSVLLCNACGLKYHKNQYCPYCHYVYGKEQEKQVFSGDALECGWITCQSCGRWCHTDCEKQYGSEKNLLNPRSYSCPNCRKAHHHAANNFDLSQVSTQIDKLYKQENFNQKKRNLPPMSQ